MRKLLLLLVFFTIAIVASAEPANPTPITVTQADGTTLQLCLVGDEFYHFNTTIDGYTILNVDGRWEYAKKNGELLVSSGIMASYVMLRGRSGMDSLKYYARSKW